jgi:uncharacterized membrane protein
MPNRIRLQKAHLSVTAALLDATVLTTLPSASVAEIAYDEMVDLTFGVEGVTGYSEAIGVSADGSVVVGGANFSGTDQAFRWTSDLGKVNIQEGSDWATGSGILTYEVLTPLNATRRLRLT